MKKTKLSSVIGLLILVFFVSCDKDCDHLAGISGEWIWTKSIGGFGGWTITPATEGSTKKLIIDNHFYKEFENDILIFESKYDLVKNQTYTSIDLENGLSYIINIEMSNLELSEYQWSDGYTHFYSRK